MANGKMDEKHGGCFAWLIRVKRSVNLRWAKARDSLRRKLDKKRRGVKPQVNDEVINEDGRPDLIITKVPIKPRPSSPRKEPKDDKSVTAPASRLEGEADEHKTVDKSPDERMFIKCDPNGDPDETEVRNFVLGIIKDAVLELEGNTTDADADKTVKPPDPDNVSMTSSVLSELATAAVHDSLTNVIDDVKEQKMAVIVDGSSLSSGAISDLATAAVHDSLTNVIDDIKEQNVPVINDGSSLSSGAISDLATAAVHDSLTNVIDDVKEQNVPVINNGSSLSSGAISDLATAAVHDSLTNVIDDVKDQNVAVIDDGSSLSSGALSVLAEAAVTESLTRIVNKPDDENQSARKSTLIPRTVTEVLEQLDIDPSIGLCVHGELEFPPCSP